MRQKGTVWARLLPFEEPDRRTGSIDLVDRGLAICVAQAETGDQLVVLGNLKFLLDRATPSRKHTDCTRVDAVSFR